MKLIAGVLAFAAFMTRSLAQNCCPAVKIIHATLVHDDDGPMNRLRRLTPEAQCVDKRNAIQPFADTADDNWQLTGEGLEESEFTRFFYDMKHFEAYWSVDGGSLAPEEQRVVALSVTQGAYFDANWSLDAAVAEPSTEECSTLEFVGHDFAAALQNEGLWAVVIADDLNLHTNWTTWLDEKIPILQSTICVEGGGSVNGCLIGVGQRTANSLLEDIRVTLASIPHVDDGSPGVANNPFTGCIPCVSTTTTTTTSTTEASTTTSTTAPETSTTPTQPPTTDATTSGGRATVAMATVLPSLIVSTFGVAAILI